MGRSSREVWAPRVVTWQQSGLTAKAYVRRIGGNPNTLDHWKWRLVRESAEIESASIESEKRVVGIHTAAETTASLVPEKVVTAGWM